jgi:hypothetical protein
MKKLTIIGLAICFAFALAGPATAVDVDFSGDYTVKGFYTSHWDLRDTSASNAYMNMCFTLDTVFKASDILSVTTSFDALDGVWGEQAAKGGVDFTRAYMTIKAPIGTFSVGRMVKGLWGTSFLDTEGDADRIKYVKKIDNLTLYAVYQKSAENDDARHPVPQTVPPTAEAADQDSDTYYLLGKYKAESTTTGLLLAFTNNKTNPVATTHVYTAIPYFVSKFGPLAIQGELGYKWGETDFDDTTKADLDIKKLAYNLEATYNFGPASVMAGYAFVSGDDDANDDENSAYGGVGAEWEKLFILTYDEDPVNNLGGAGNLTATGNYGAKIIYGGATFSPLDNLELGVVVGMADADEVQIANQEDDIGFEYDLTLNWEIYDNLTYTAIAAFLNAGDIWQGGDATVDVENTYALFHKLELAF